MTRDLARSKQVSCLPHAASRAVPHRAAGPANWTVVLSYFVHHARFQPVEQDGRLNPIMRAFCDAIQTLFAKKVYRATAGLQDQAIGAGNAGRGATRPASVDRATGFGQGYR
jgi:hypothetical protein